MDPNEEESLLIDSKINKLAGFLKCILQSKNVRINELEMKLEMTNKQNEELFSKIADLNIQIGELKKDIIDMKSEYSKLEEDSVKLKELMDPTQEMRRRGHTIRPGDITHEDVAKDFKIMFSNRNILKPIGISEAECRTRLLTQMFESAYDVSKELMLEKVAAEVTKLFDTPTRLYTIDQKRENDIYIPWNSRKEALSLLLSLVNEKEIPECLIDEIERKLSAKEVFTSKQVAEIRDVTASVAKLTWSMVTLSPPVTFSGSLESFPLSDELWELTNIDGLSNDEINNGNCTKTCRRPVVFFSPLGTIGLKGHVALLPYKEQDKGYKYAACEASKHEDLLSNEQPVQEEIQIIKCNGNYQVINNEDIDEIVPSLLEAESCTNGKITGSGSLCHPQGDKSEDENENVTDEALHHLPRTATKKKKKKKKKT